MVIADKDLKDDYINSIILNDIEQYKHLQIRSAMNLETLVNLGFDRHNIDRAVCQIEFLAKINRDIISTTKDAIESVPSKRGDGKLGSSGK